MSYAINESQREDAFIIMAAYCLIPNLYIQTAKKKKKKKACSENSQIKDIG